MALLASCWLIIIESVIIPDGFRKWFYLTFYIPPIFLFVCQIFLWLQRLSKWILVVFFYPLRIICFLGLYSFRFFRDCIIFVFSFTKFNTNVGEAAEEADDESSAVIVSCNQNQISVSYGCSSWIAAPSAPCKLKVFKVQKNNGLGDQDMDIEEYSGVDHEEKNKQETNEYVSSISYSEFSTNDDDDGLKEYSLSLCGSNSPKRSLNDDDDHLNTYSTSVGSGNSIADQSLHMNDEYTPPSICIPSTSPVVEREITQRVEYQESQVTGREIIERDNQHREASSDAFYKKYTERMRWFDVLNYDRTCGISAVLNKQLGAPSPAEIDHEPAEDYSSPYISWNKLTKKRLLRSLESDFELVYVAQSCLSWEALYYQYTKVKALAQSTSNNGVFYGNIFCEFQKFQVLLERFLEDERCEGKRIWNYVRGRFARNSLLQVPQISGFSEEEKEDVKAGEAVSVKEALKGIERCIQAFGVFVKVDNNKKPWWKLKSPLWTYPPVEDPRDLALLRSLTRRLQKKELCLKDLQGKQRCWIKRAAKLVEESQRKEMLFTMIDMKLVSRVLQMSTVSSSQLKWCQQKLDNIEFKEGKICRGFTFTLFPPS